MLIVGGGDSAMRLGRQPARHGGSEVPLVHRREGFRAHELTVGQVLEAADRGDVGCCTCRSDQRDHRRRRASRGCGCSTPTTRSTSSSWRSTRSCLQLGFKTALGPLKEWGFEVVEGSDRRGLADEDIAGAGLGVRRYHNVRRQAEADRDRVRGVGDRASPRRSTRSAPTTKIQPKYSTNTGVPGRRCRPAVSSRGPTVERPHGPGREHLRRADPVLRELIDEIGADGLATRARPPGRPLRRRWCARSSASSCRPSGPGDLRRG